MEREAALLERLAAWRELRAVEKEFDEAVRRKDVVWVESVSRRLDEARARYDALGEKGGSE